MPSSDRQTMARAAGAALTEAADRLRALRIVAGFDAVVDSIIDVVDTRAGETYTRIDSIEAFARRIAAAAGRSTNIELAVTQKKVGGNACNLAAAAVALGARLTLLANAADEGDAAAFHPVLRPLTDRCEGVILLGCPSATDALEFSDGKVMLGKTATLDAISWDSIIDAAGGLGALAATLAGADALVTANWTMTRAMNEVWSHLATDVLPAMAPIDRPRRLFVDLADPAKRTDTDLRTGLAHLRAINAHVPVALGLNLAEATRLASLVGAPAPPSDAMTDGSLLQASARALRTPLGLDVVVLHSRHAAASAGGDACASFAGPYTRTPTLSTGAGDHFNAGWLLADRLGLEPDQRLAVGCAVAGRYVRTGLSPTFDQLCAFLSDLPVPEAPIEPVGALRVP